MSKPTHERCHDLIAEYAVWMFSPWRAEDAAKVWFDGLASEEQAFMRDTATAFGHAWARGWISAVHQHNLQELGRRELDRVEREAKED
jgi:hypothetical protein